jgi:uridylate kinase
MRVVLRIGGSVVASPINTCLISKYADLLTDIKKQGHHIAAVVGGGTLARDFIADAKDLGLEEKAQDEIAISVSRIFAQLLLKRLGKIACKTVPITIDEAVKCFAAGKISVMGGLKPGMTTDTVAALLAEGLKADLLVKGTDQDGVFDKDPRNNADAVKIDHLSISELCEMFSETKHKAGVHQIVDSGALGILKKERIKLVIVNGYKPENILLAINGEKVGTIVD